MSKNPKTHPIVAELWDERNLMVSGRHWLASRTYVALCEAETVWPPDELPLVGHRHPDSDNLRVKHVMPPQPGGLPRHWVIYVIYATDGADWWAEADSSGLRMGIRDDVPMSWPPELSQSTNAS